MSYGEYLKNQIDRFESGIKSALIFKKENIEEINSILEKNVEIEKSMIIAEETLHRLKKSLIEFEREIETEQK